jgi:hypothetical protein
MLGTKSKNLSFISPQRGGVVIYNPPSPAHEQPPSVPLDLPLSLTLPTYFQGSMLDARDKEQELQDGIERVPRSCSDTGTYVDEADLRAFVNNAEWNLGERADLFPSFCSPVARLVNGRRLSTNRDELLPCRRIFRGRCSMLGTNLRAFVNNAEWNLGERADLFPSFCSPGHSSLTSDGAVRPRAGQSTAPASRR